MKGGQAMNKCDENIRQLIVLYADGELSSKEIALVDEHVASCEDCREELEMYLEIANELNLEDIIVPKDFHSDLMNRLETMEPKKAFEDETENKSKKPGFYSRYSKYMNIAAMLVFVIFLSVIGLTRGNQWDESSIMESDTSATAEMTTAESSDDTFFEGDMEADNTSSAEPAMMDVATEEVESQEKNSSESRKTEESKDISSDSNNGVENESEEAINIGVNTEVSTTDSADMDQTEDSVVYIEEASTEEFEDVAMDNEAAYTVADDEMEETIETVTEETVESSAASTADTTAEVTETSDENESASSETAAETRGSEEMDGNSTDLQDEYGSSETDLKVNDEVNMTLNTEGKEKVVNTPLIIIIAGLVISVIGTFLIFFLRRTK